MLGFHSELFQINSYATSDVTEALYNSVLRLHEIDDVSILYDPETDRVGLFNGPDSSISVSADYLHVLAGYLQRLDLDLNRLDLA